MIRKFLLLLTFLGIIFSPAQVYAQSSYPTYIIQPGDSLGGIANLFGISLEELISINGIVNPDSISPGQSLQIPGIGDTPGLLVFRSVGLSENIKDLETIFNVDPAWLITQNHLTSPTTVYSGTELLVLEQENNLNIIFLESLGYQESLLEAAVRGNINPVELQLVNKLDSSFRIIENDRIFSPELPEVQVNRTGPQVSISPLPMSQGSTEVIKVQGLGITNVIGQLNNQELYFSTDREGTFFAIQGIHAMAKPGLSKLSLEVTFSDGEKSTINSNVLLKAGDFDFEELSVDPDLINPEVTEPENEFIQQLISPRTPDKYWEGLFQSPAVYQYYNSLFGTRRTYNGSDVVTFHAGVDFGGGITLPIFAPAPGKVVFAGPLTVRGNTVFIDHGLGIYSGFFHQDKLNVKSGDFVTTGQQIGEVGNTGRIDGTDSYYGAGAHLHWELWANGIQVDPLTWLTTAFP